LIKPPIQTNIGKFTIQDSVANHASTMRFEPASRLVGRHLQSLIQRSASFSTTSTEAPIFLVYGATGGIGAELCKRLANHDGAQVILAGRDESKLAALAASLPDPSQASIQIVDVLSPESVDAATAAVVKQHGHITGVANCVGSVVLKSAHATTMDEFENTLRINLFSSFNILKASVKAMMKNPNNAGGSLVFCSSAVAKHGLANHEAIAAAKGGISAMALSAAATYAPKNIRINCVAPGLTKTPMTSKITGNEGMLKASVAMHALKRIGEPTDIASAIEFLLDPKNNFITGQVLAVDGGLSSLRPM
jgi:NAD(P)-dependent dehydrogenase (short-subunit alcohol dehydrogenase family)